MAPRFIIRRVFSSSTDFHSPRIHATLASNLDAGNVHSRYSSEKFRFLKIKECLKHFIRVHKFLWHTFHLIFFKFHHLWRSQHVLAPEVSSEIFWGLYKERKISWRLEEFTFLNVAFTSRFKGEGIFACPLGCDNGPSMLLRFAALTRRD